MESPLRWKDLDISGKKRVKKNREYVQVHFVAGNSYMIVRQIDHHFDRGALLLPVLQVAYATKRPHWSESVCQDAIVQNG